MRYRLTSPGVWALAFRPTLTGGAGDMPVRFGKYLSPGEVPYDGSFRLKGLGAPIYDSSGNIIGDDGTDSAAVSTPGWLQNLVTGATQFFVGRQQLDAISQLNQINIQRAAAGLPPISSNVLQQPGVQVGISPQVEQLLLYGGLSVAALWMLGIFARR